MRYSIRFFLAALLLPALAGCIGPVRDDDLTGTLTYYAKMLRWGEYGAAYACHRDADGHSPLPAERLKAIRLTAYEVIRGPAGNDQEVAQTARIRYYDESRMQEKTIEHQQLWRYNAEQGHWFQVTPPPPLD